MGASQPLEEEMGNWKKAALWVAILVVALAAALPAAAAPVSTSAPVQPAAVKAGNGPLNVRAGTLVNASGTHWQVHSKGGIHYHNLGAFNGLGIVGQYDYGYELYSFRYCVGGTVQRERNRWGIWINWCTGGKWVWEYLDADSLTSAQ